MKVEKEKVVDSFRLYEHVGVIQIAYEYGAALMHSLWQLWLEGQIIRIFVLLL